MAGATTMGISFIGCHATLRKVIKGAVSLCATNPINLLGVLSGGFVRDAEPDSGEEKVIA